MDRRGFNQFSEGKEKTSNSTCASFTRFHNFFVKYDANLCKVGAVLSQNGHPIAFHSKNLTVKHEQKKLDHI